MNEKKSKCKHNEYIMKTEWKQYEKMNTKWYRMETEWIHNENKMKTTWTLHENIIKTKWINNKFKNQYGMNTKWTNE